MRRTAVALIVVILAMFVSSVGFKDSVVSSQSPLPNPQTVTVVDGSSPGEVVVSWQAVPGADFYRLGWMVNSDYEAELKRPGGFWLSEFRYSNIINRGQTSHTLTRLTPGIEYWFVVGSHSAFYGKPQWARWTKMTLRADTSGGQICPAPGGPAQGACPTIESATFRMSDERYQAIDAGKNHTCAIKLDNTIECWGDNTRGQTNAPEGRFRSVSAGGVYSCGIDSDNQLQCWGHQDIPNPPTGDYTHVSVGDEHACAITLAAKDDNHNDINRVNCWGLPNNDGRTVNQIPAHNPDLWTTVSAGSDFNCARNDNLWRGYRHLRVHCWGNNSAIYDEFDVEEGVVTVSAGNRHICGLYDNGAIACSGNDVHQQVTGLPKAQDEGAVEDFYTYDAVSAGGGHSCGLRTTGNIRCWGDNLRGQAAPPGNNDELNVNLQGVGDFTAISAGDDHTCGLRENGMVVCWGYNPHGQADPP